MPTAIITKGKGLKSKQFRFILKGDNGEQLCNGSEHYTRKANALKTLSRYFGNFKVFDSTIKGNKPVEKSNVHNHEWMG